MTTKRPGSRITVRVPALLAVVALAVASLAACGSDGGVGASPTQSASPSVSCPAPQTTTTPGAERTLTSNGERRTYNVWLPTGYTGTKPVPLVVDFHGAAGNSLKHAASSPISLQAPGRGYLLVVPQGVQGDASGIGWKSPGGGKTPDDVKFVADLLKEVAANYCVDPSSKYATGFSSGAAFTTYLSCRIDTWAAVAPLGGVNLVQPCVGRPPVPLITFHGTNDTYVPYVSSVPASLPDPDAYYLGDVQTVITQFAARNGCAPAPLVTTIVETVKKSAYQSCTDGADVVLFTVDGAGHTYPGGPPLPAETAEELGGQSQAIDSGKVVLDFFDAHHRAKPPVDVPAPWAPSAAPTGSATPTAVPSASGAEAPGAIPTITVAAAPQ